MSGTFYNEDLNKLNQNYCNFEGVNDIHRYKKAEGGTHKRKEINSIRQRIRSLKKGKNSDISSVKKKKINSIRQSDIYI